MSRLFDPSKQARASGAPVIRPSGNCSRSGCTGKTSIQFAHVTNPNGMTLTVIPSEAINHDWTLRTGWTLLSWIERCFYCYSVERLLEDRARWRDTHDTPYPIPDWRDPPFCHIRSADDFRRYTGVGVDRIINNITEDARI